MVIDLLKNAEMYEGLNEAFPAVFEILKSLNADSPEEKIVLEEGDVWVAVTRFADTPEREEALFEAHRDFIDVHYIVSGEEVYGYENVEKLQSVVPYDREKDCEFLSGAINEVTLKTGDFLVAMPQDAHIPCLEKLSEGTLVRAVAKIRI